MDVQDDTETEELPDNFPFLLTFYKGVGIWEGAEMEDIPQFKVRDDDVWVCSFPRSGTTLTQEMTYTIMTLDFKKATTVNLDDRFPMIETKVPGTRYYRGVKHLDNLPTDKPRFIKSHLHYFLLPDDVTKRKKGKIIYIYRNPKASVLSLYKVLKYLHLPPAPSLREYFELFLKGNEGVLAGPWGRHVREFWEHRNDENILFLQFEKVIKDRRGTIKKIADFLGRSLTEKDLDNVMKHTSLENMRNNPACNFQYVEEAQKVDKTEGAFINKGLTHGWRVEVPEDLQKRVDAMIKEELKDTDLIFD